MRFVTRLGILVVLFAIICKAQISSHQLDAAYLWVNGSDPEWQDLFY